MDQTECKTLYHCTEHKKQKKLAQTRVEDGIHANLEAEEYLVDTCEIHPYTRPNTPSDEEWTKVPKQDPHASEAWAFCYDDGCSIHLLEKEGLGYFPKGKGPKNQELLWTRIPKQKTA